MAGLNSEDFVSAYVGDYCPEYDHNILEVVDILSNDSEADHIFTISEK